MSRRKTVQLNLPVVNPLIKKKCRSNVVFCEQMGRSEHTSWVSDWNRTPSKNLPSPEEAAQMCVLLDAEPEDILLATGNTDEETAKRQADIALVRELVEKQGIKKGPTADTGDERDPVTQEIFDFIDHSNKKELDEIHRYIQFLKSQRPNNGGQT